MAYREKQTFVDGFLKLYGEDGLYVNQVSIPWAEKEVKGLFDLCKGDIFKEKLFNDWLDREVA